MNIVRCAMNSLIADSSPSGRASVVASAAIVSLPSSPSGVVLTAACSHCDARPTPLFTAASNTSSASGAGSASPRTRTQYSAR